MRKRHNALHIIIIAVLIVVISSSCDDTAKENPSASDSTTSPDPSYLATVDPDNPSISPSGDSVPIPTEPLLITNPEDPFANNAMPDIQIDYLSERAITPLQPDVLDDMPSKTYTSYREGWALEEVLPIGFHMYIECNRSGNFFYEAFDVFSICEVRPGGRQEEKYAIFDGNGRQITNAKFSTDWFAAWLPGMVDVEDYMDNEGNIYSPMEYDYNFPGTHGWVLHSVPGDPSYYIFTAPTGKKIICKAENSKKEELKYCIISNEVLVISTPEYVIAYNRDGKPIWKLEFDGGEFEVLQINGIVLPIANSEGKSAIYDKNGIRLTEFIYDSVSSFYGYSYIRVGIDNKYGLIDMTCSEVFPCIYDDIIQDSTTKSVIVQKNGKYGYIEDPSSGQIGLPCIYDKMYFTYGENEVFVKIHDKYFLYKNGALRDVPFDSEIYRNDFFDEGIYLMYTGFLESTIIRDDGTKIIENTYLEYSQPGDPILFRDPKTGLYGFLNSAAEVIIEPQFELADNFRKGFAIVRKDGYIKLIDKNGDVIMDTIFNDVVCWNPETLVIVVNYTPGGPKTEPWNHNSVPESRCGLVKLIMPDEFATK